MKRFLNWISESLNFKVKIALHLIIWGNYTWFLYYFLSRWSVYEVETRFLWIITFIIVATIILLPVTLDSDTMSTIFVLFSVLVLGVFMFAIIAKTCYDESLYATTFVKNFVDQNKNFIVQKVQNVTLEAMERNGTLPLNDTQISAPAGQSAANDMWYLTETYCDGAVMVALQYYKYYKRFISTFVDTQTLTNDEIRTMGQRFCHNNVSHARNNIYQWTMEVFNLLASNVGWFGMGVTNFFKTTFEMINSLGDVMFSVLMFLMFLYYFIRYDEYCANLLRQYSPLTDHESEKIFNSVASKIENTFNYAMALAFCRFVITWISFWYANFKIIWVFSFLSGFLSIIPVLSSWIVWIPAAIFCISRDGIWSTPWFVIIAANVGLILLDSILYNSFFKGDKDQRPEVLGISIILGVYAFGWTGIFKGPLSVGLTITLMRIYKEYMNPKESEESKNISNRHPRRTPRTNRALVRQPSLVDQFAARMFEGVQNFLADAHKPTVSPISNESSDSSATPVTPSAFELTSTGELAKRKTVNLADGSTKSPSGNKTLSIRTNDSKSPSGKKTK